MSCPTPVCLTVSSSGYVEEDHHMDVNIIIGAPAVNVSIFKHEIPIYYDSNMHCAICKRDDSILLSTFVR